MTIEKAFGQVIRDLRMQRGLSQGQLAQLVGLARQAVWEIEHGRAGPRLAIVFGLADALQVGADELMRTTTFVHRNVMD